MTIEDKRDTCGKRRKFHVLSGDGSGSGAGSGFGDGYGVGLGSRHGSEGGDGVGSEGGGGVGFGLGQERVGSEECLGPNMDPVGEGGPNNAWEEDYDYYSEGFKTPPGSNDERGPNGPEFNDRNGYGEIQLELGMQFL
ncbi:hypothetical protein PIB30_038010 [Stylosanthes scabra]|uniref:Uncharacterized protein n=1 Tax=Stylosanthes scabra TaxID=79078 RepID=A0ABU6RE09_9FABA|nr:hypothetical protein [Stylosanthes scabra]